MTFPFLITLPLSILEVIGFSLEPEAIVANSSDIGDIVYQSSTNISEIDDYTVDLDMWSDNDTAVIESKRISNPPFYCFIPSLDGLLK